MLCDRQEKESIGSETDGVSRKGTNSMIIVKIKGGLGNQLFQYFSGYAIGKSKNQKVRYDLSYFKYGSSHRGINKQRFELNNLLASPVDEVTDGDGTFLTKALNNNYINKFFRVIGLCNFRVGSWNYLLQNRSRVKIDLPINFKNLYMDGYWQNLSWIEKYRDQIIKRVSLNGVSKSAIDMSKIEEECNSISVHVRRTDLLCDNADLQNGNYYSQAVNYMKEHVDTPSFFVFSDDIEWCKTELFKDSTENVHYSKNKTAVDDFYCMMNCKHNIIAFSTFSWWAAWLNKNEDQIVISPDFGEREDILPGKWIIL